MICILLSKMKYMHLHQRYRLSSLIWQKQQHLLQHLPFTSRRPCCFCLIDNKDLNNMALTNVIMRTPEKMREAINLNQANELSIHADFNFFGSLRILIFTKQLFQIECICLILE